MNALDGFRIRLAVPSERAALEDLQRRASLNNPGDRDALLAHPDAIDVPVAQIERGDVWVADADGVIAGFAAIVSREDGDVELDALFVDPARWRHGIGRLLVEHCSVVACRRGAKAMHVIGNPHAERFYTSCAFEVAGRTHTRFGPGLLMRRPL